MAIQDLFQGKSGKILSNLSIDEIGNDVESGDFVKKSLEEKDKFVPYIDYSNPNNFAFFGLAEQYYSDSINHILATYPYDGSLKEKVDWNLSASNLDKYILEKEYPRTTGYINLGLNYGTILSSSNDYDLFGTGSYIGFRGGPHTASDGMIGKNIFETFNYSNKYDPNTRRESNLEINGDTGFTFEFWIQKTNFISGSESSKQVIFDIWNSGTIGDPSYGRFRVELHPGISGENSKIFVCAQSGSFGLTNGSYTTLLGLGNGLKLLDNNWHQYSISVQNTGSQMIARLYTSGSLNDTIVTGSSIGLVTGTMIGTVGALISSTSASFSQLGWGKLSGSLDELRYWKTRRNAKEIGRFWATQVGAGTNTDESNTSLGLYYKFNEGIVNTSSVNPLDCKVLDYSGRISNGNWIGYITGSRNTGSALELANATNFEFKDPIIYSGHPDILNLIVKKQEIGFDYDSTNNSNIYSSIPEWISKDDQDKGSGELKKLTQTMSSFLDNVFLQIEALPKLKSANYISSSLKPIPFVSRFLESMGMATPEIFTDAESLEILSGRDDYRQFDEKLSDIKNRIYQNIYNNLSYIYKSKGTEKSFRNVLRCFGIDEELIKINLYGDNVTYEFKDNFKYIAAPKKYVDFNNVDRFYGTVYQHTSSASSSRSYIAAPSNVVYHGNTYQCEVIFPKKFEKDSDLYFGTSFSTVSLFGAHTAECSERTDKTWSSPDLGNFQIFAVKPKIESKDVYFVLSGTNGSVLPVLSSSVFTNVYDNQKWNFNLRVKPITYPLADGVTGSANNNFTIEFDGFNSELDFIKNSFSLTGSISSSAGVAFMTAPKRFYVGAHRTNFTGSVLNYSDVKISSLRVWMKYLTDENIKMHSKDVQNFGTIQPYKNNSLTELNRPFGN